MWKRKKGGMRQLSLNRMGRQGYFCVLMSIEKKRRGTGEKRRNPNIGLIRSDCLADRLLGIPDSKYFAYRNFESVVGNNARRKSAVYLI